MTSESPHGAAVKRLVRRAQRGDAGAFESLARSCGTTLYRVAASCLGNQEADVADAIQETLVAAWRNIGSLEQPRYFKTWLIRICINACRQVQRRRRATVPLDSVGEERLDASLRAAGRVDETTRAAAAAEANAAFGRLVDAAGEAYALVITLYYGEGYSTAEIAELLSMSPEAVRQRLFRGRARIKRALAENPALAHPVDHEGPARAVGHPSRPRAPDGEGLMQATAPA
ncbi:sigma-70 family RNA polymerase sigma factor [Adlercreutzia sp. R21]|uniref:Sigma-70 family RNA polymerase sigma factor n=1 Tax=Adlercreutzia wanghongyangiae TaxID=3111451 RepID=A0ABU6IHV4_9ACTN|nr:sigma-70 family RNA polymerase sigma factor [Adlercreutzia sp. R21]MEC4176037.1 sigma-70 family RNA polymerase sigma factor [Adlercreutzia sp. R7]MEC4183724.1 sigma-70 family RNA polymerase sigma factor [Adlercreutzia sp. R21]